MSEPQYILCPYCGHLQRSTERCGECGGLFEPLSRKATQIAMGPWFIRDKRLPFRPGCSFEVLKKQIQAGRVSINTVMRGPTTRQFWAVARHVPGVAHLLGLCHKCGAKVSPRDKECASCQAVFKEPNQRNEMGLIFPTSDAAHTAQRELDEEVAALTSPLKGKTAGSEAKGDTAAAASTPRRPGEDLLQEVLGSPTAKPPREGKRSASSPKPAQAPVAVAPQALDFNPTDEAAPPRLSPMTVLLITLNVALMLALVLVFWWASR